jgi:hypothetical protein
MSSALEQKTALTRGACHRGIPGCGAGPAAAACIDEYECARCAAGYEPTLDMCADPSAHSQP